MNREVTKGMFHWPYPQQRQGLWTPNLSSPTANEPWGGAATNRVRSRIPAPATGSTHSPQLCKTIAPTPRQRPYAAISPRQGLVPILLLTLTGGAHIRPLVRV